MNEFNSDIQNPQANDYELEVPNNKDPLDTSTQKWFEKKAPTVENEYSNRDVQVIRWTVAQLNNPGYAPTLIQAQNLLLLNPRQWKVMNGSMQP